ncbi:polysaccharide biosynthesis C-terminal domain-containing protein [Rubripirellula amarantea]|nr:polysaccharide biosynthesis C-terminal domain-containing protein [Rubripirellula amarantea]
MSERSSQQILGFKGCLMPRLENAIPLARTAMSRGLGAISQVALALAVTHHLPKSESGEFLFYLTLFTVISPLLLLGTSVYAMRQLAGSHDNQQSAMLGQGLIRMNLCTLAVTASVVLAIALCLDVFFSNEVVVLSGKAAWLAAAASFAGVSLAVASHLHGTGKLATSITFSHIAIPSLTVLMLFMVETKTVAKVIQLHTLATVITAAISLLVWLAYFRPMRFPPTSNDPVKPDQNQFARPSSFAFFRDRDVRRVCIDLWSLNGFQLVMNWAPIIVAGAILIPSDLAELNVAQRAGNLINFLLIVVAFTFAPKFRKHWAANRVDELRNSVARCSRLLVGLGTALLIAVLILSEKIMGVFGSNFTGGAMILVIYAIGQYINVITGAVNQLMTMSDDERTLRHICFLSATTAVLLSVVLTWQWGAPGAAAATAIALTLQNALAVSAVKKRLGFWIFDMRNHAQASQ